MINLLFGIHIMICVLLIIVILIQAGRGGGLVEGFSGVESMFGPKTSAFLTRTTSIFSILFFVSCISLALVSARQSRSLMQGLKEEKPAAQVSQTQAPAEAKKEIQQQPAVKQEQEIKKENISAEKQKEAATVKSESVKQEPVQKK